MPHDMICRIRWPFVLVRVLLLAVACGRAWVKRIRSGWRWWPSGSLAMYSTVVMSGWCSTRPWVCCGSCGPKGTRIASAEPSMASLPSRGRNGYGRHERGVFLPDPDLGFVASAA